MPQTVESRALKLQMQCRNKCLSNYFRHVELKVTNSVKAVNVETGWTSLSYMDLL